MLRVAAGLVGFATVGLVLLGVIRTVVLPRGTTSMVSRLTFVAVQRSLLAVSRLQRSYERRDAVLALMAPVAVLLQPVVWLTLITLGYDLLFYAAGVEPFGEAFHLSGSSLLTLGFAPVDGMVQTLLAFSEATIGLGLVALIITYLPTMYSAFSRREAAVALMEVRGGSPPSAVEFLIRFQRIGWGDHLNEVWSRWEEWFADVDESHTSLAALAFFRSPQPDRSWVTAAGAVLDAASIHASSLAGGPHPQADLTIRAGYVALRRIADVFGVVYDPDPAPADPISITRQEYDAAYDQLQAAGLDLVADRDQGWRDFAGWRVNYDRVLLELCSITAAPTAPWSGDRAPRPRAIPVLLRRRQHLRPTVRK